MKKIHYLFLSLYLIPLCGFAQSKLHFVYIRHDNSTDIEILENSLDKFFQQHSADDYIVFYSDVNPIIMQKNNFSLHEIKDAINNKNSIVGINPKAELNAISSMYENYKGLHNENVIIDCFVSEEFFDYDYANSIIAQFLIVNGLHNTLSVDVNFYPCGGKISEKQNVYSVQYNIQNKTNFIRL